MYSHYSRIVSHHRYRDVVPEIRSAVLRALGNWIRDYPAYFLEEKYLKYLAWSLYDKVIRNCHVITQQNAEVRLTTLEVLDPLIRNTNFMAVLNDFVGRYQGRIEEMSLDVDTEVGKAAIRILTHLDK